MQEVMAADSPAAKNFRENVLRILDERDITMTKVAEDTGMGRAGLSRILHGKEAVTLSRAERIADYLGEELSALIKRMKAEKKIPQTALNGR